MTEQEYYNEGFLAGTTWDPHSDEFRPAPPLVCQRLECHGDEEEHCAGYHQSRVNQFQWKLGFRDGCQKRMYETKRKCIEER